MTPQNVIRDVIVSQCYGCQYGCLRAWPFLYLIHQEPEPRVCVVSTNPYL